ncbi:MAG TPA: LytTR family DNA-binding domain-containing protein [Steroidobacteraceae bacterium]|jgi:two-component system LytT family response regulator
MLDVVIVDDEPAGRRTLREYCAREPDLNVIGEHGDSRAALEAIRARPPHLLFLDIQMNSLDGVSLARALDPRSLPLIVFVTAYDQYALEAFDVSAVDYLLKPFDDERFHRTLERVRRRREAETVAQRQETLTAVLSRIERGVVTADVRPRVLAEAGSRMHMLDVAQVEAAEADRNYVKLLIGRDTYQARSTLQQAEKTLQSQPMLRISRSCLVNMNHVREVSRTPRGDFILVLAGGATVTSSEGFREAVRQHLDRLKVCSG